MDGAAVAGTAGLRRRAVRAWTGMAAGTAVVLAAALGVTPDRAPAAASSGPARSAAVPAVGTVAVGTVAAGAVPVALVEPVSTAGTPVAAAAVGTVAAVPAGTTAAPGAAAAVAVEFALAQIGLPYVWGGNGPAAGHAGFDCSGLTTAAYAAAGIRLPRTAHTQFQAGPRLSPDAELLPGDLVFFGTASRIRHVGMYLGGGRMVNAPTFGKPVQIARHRYESDSYMGATRPAAGSGPSSGPFLPPSGPAPTGPPEFTAPVITTDPAAVPGVLAAPPVVPPAGLAPPPPVPADVPVVPLAALPGAAPTLPPSTTVPVTTPPPGTTPPPTTPVSGTTPPVVTTEPPRSTVPASTEPPTTTVPPKATTPPKPVEPRPVEPPPVEPPPVEPPPVEPEPGPGPEPGPEPVQEPEPVVPPPPVTAGEASRTAAADPAAVPTTTPPPAEPPA